MVGDRNARFGNRLFAGTSRSLAGGRDAVNVLDKANWGQFAIFSLVLWLLTLVVVPAMMLGIAYLGKRLARLPQSSWAVMKDCTGTLIPLGLLVWVAFVIPMLTVNMTFLLQSLSDPFGWGWNLLGLAGSAWHQVWPRAIPWLQVACLAVGLGYSLRNGWRIWLGLSQEPRACAAGDVAFGVAAVVVLGIDGLVLRELGMYCEASQRPSMPRAQNMFASCTAHLRNHRHGCGRRSRSFLAALIAGLQGSHGLSHSGISPEHSCRGDRGVQGNSGEAR